MPTPLVGPAQPVDDAVGAAWPSLDQVLLRGAGVPQTVGGPGRTVIDFSIVLAGERGDKQGDQIVTSPDLARRRPVVWCATCAASRPWDEPS